MSIIELIILLYSGSNWTQKEKYKNILNNPHLADWYYGLKLE
jgi:hypothetical protein